ncbi:MULTISPECIES: hypothetical protein [Bacillus]|uniref:hypothetical protein n=1 Tax=Bacillus TaxID=1386 RepID=UPI000A9F7995|nr:MULTISPECIES: hypothetical protein [Bacillus]
MNCKCCWQESEGTFCNKCSEFSVSRQIEEKELMIVNYEMLYHTLKHDLENYKLEDVKEMYSYLKEDLFSVLNGYYGCIKRLEEEIEELKSHKEVRLQFLFVDKKCRRMFFVCEEKYILKPVKNTHAKKENGFFYKTHI